MKPSRNYVRDNVPLSRFGVLVAQLESIVASASQQLPDPIICFDLLSDLISSIDEEPKESILLWQRKCEDALYSLLVLGARRPVRHLASVAMAKIISKGDGISIYSRASTLQGFLSDGKKSEPHKLAGASQCLGELYHHFGRRITSGLLETTIIAVKLMKFQEVFVRQEALLMLQKALEGSGGAAASSAYSEAFRLITRSAVGDKSYVVRIAAARCLKAFSSIGGPGLGVAELDSSAYLCVKALEDPVSSVRDAFAEALGLLLALGMNPEAQVQPRGKGPYPPAKKLDGGLQRHLSLSFSKASGIRMRDIRIGATLSWVFFLQAIRIKYLLPDNELQNYALQVMDMLHADNALDAHALACILYTLRVGITDQMTEPTQREFLVFLGKQLECVDVSASMKIAALRTISYTLKTLGEVPLEFKEVCDNTVVAAVSHSSQIVRIEAALTLKVMAEVDPTCVGGLISYGMTTLSALRENISFEKGSNLKFGLDSFHGQATVLAALVHVSPKLPLGYPARLPKSILEISKQMLEKSSRNPVAATIEKEAGWLLLSSLLSSMPHQELEAQVFDILSLWANLFSGNPQQEINHTVDLTSTIRVWSAAIEALTAFVRCFISPNADIGILLQPVMVYLSSALEYITLLQGKELPNVKLAIDILIIRTLMAYKSLPKPMAYKSDHLKIIQLCTVPYRDASRCEESSCLRLLLDKRDAWLGPWTPGRDWLEDELRTFQGGKDGIMPCVWESDISSFPQLETINKMLVNEMLLCFGIMFASQDAVGKLFLLGTIEQCLKAGKKQSWHAVSVTNICVGLLAGLKALIASRPQPLGPDVLNSAMTIFQSILAEGDICASHRRASSEGLGLLARLGNDIFTARMTRLLLGDLSATTDSNYAGSIAFALGCIHRSAGGMALSTLVPATVSALSLLAKSAATSLQIWSLHGLLLTVEAAGFSYVSHVQATLGLSTDILLSEENGLIELQQGVGRLINATVAVLGPELSPGSIFFSRCKSVIAEISLQQETATLLESVRFTQQLVIFAPRAVSVHFHVQTLLSTLSSRQPTLRHLAISTLRHLIEKDPGCIIDEQIEDNLFHMLDEETDPEIGNLVRAAIMRLLLASCPSRPSHWIIVCRSMILSTAIRRGGETNTNSEKDSSYGLENDPGLNVGDDDENMVASSSGTNMRGYALEASGVNTTRDKHLRYRTRVFAAECLSYLPSGVGDNPAHFDLSLARKQNINGKNSGDWLVIYIQELISLAYQISTIQFENMRPIGVGLLSMIVDKFEASADPEVSGHLLLEQYQAQLVSAVRTALDASSGPILLEAGLQLATKIMTSGILGGDQSAVKRIFALLSRPLNEFKDIYYPSFAEWVSSKIKIRLLAAHASLKCYTYAFLRRHHSDIPDEYLALLPLFAKSSDVLGKYWMQFLKDYSYTCLSLNLQKNRNPFLDGIESSLVVMKLQSTFEEAWPVILQALALDAVPITLDRDSKTNIKHIPGNCLISGHSMVELEQEEYQFLWSFALLVLFQQHQLDSGRQIVSLSLNKARCGEESAVEETNPTALRLYEIVLPVFQFLSSERFFKADFLTMDVCQELLQVFSRIIYVDNSWNSLALSVLTQIVQSCPEHILESEKFSCLAVELLFAYIFHSCPRADVSLSGQGNIESLIFPLLNVAKALVVRFQSMVWKQSESMVLALLLLGYNCMREASTELWYLTVIDFLKGVNDLLRKLVNGFSKNSKDSYHGWKVLLGTCLNVIADLTKDCIRAIHLLEYKRSDARKLLQLKLSFSLEESISLAKLTYEIECPGDTEGSIYYTLFKKSTNNVRSALKGGNLQVQAIGLQVLKTNVQRSTSLGDCTFLVVFCAELVLEILAIAQTMLKKPLSKESVAIVGECLRYLMLLQTLARSSECQRAFLNLLLQAVILVFSAVEDDLSQEAADVKAVAVRLVSHVAQIPTSSIHIKDVLLSMPTTHRQQLQDLIRASVAHDQNATQTTSAAALEIKLPVPKDSQPSAVILPPSRKGENSNLATSTATSNSNQISIEDEEEDDDWEAFQSFPASTHTVENELEEENAVEESEFDEKPFVETRIASSGDTENSSLVQHIKTAGCIDDQEHQCDHEEEDSGSKVNIDKTGGLLASQTEKNVLGPHTDQLLIREEENVLTSDSKEETKEQARGYAEANVEEDHEQCVLPRDREEKTTEQARGYAEENVGEDHEWYVLTREREEEATGQARGYTEENVGEDQEQHVLEEATEQAQGLAEENVGEDLEPYVLTRDREEDATEQARAEENVGEDHEQRKETPKHEGDLSLLPASSSVIDGAGETNIIHEHGESAKEAEESTDKTGNGST